MTESLRSHSCESFLLLHTSISPSQTHTHTHARHPHRQTRHTLPPLSVTGKHYAEGVFKCFVDTVPESWVVIFQYPAVLCAVIEVWLSPLTLIWAAWIIRIHTPFCRTTLHLIVMGTSYCNFLLPDDQTSSVFFLLEIGPWQTDIALLNQTQRNMLWINFAADFLSFFHVNLLKPQSQPATLLIFYPKVVWIASI